MKTRGLSIFAISLLLCAVLSSCNLFKKECKHSYTEKVVAPTCVADGYTEHTCTKCGEVVTDTVVQKLGHAYSDEIVAPDCFEEGYTKHTCSACGDSYNDTFVAKTKHRFNASSCPNCGMEEKTENITPDTEWYSADTIQFSITTPEQLAGLASLVNEGTDFTNQVIYLEADIDLGYYEWIPIGNADNAFKGTFNGNGHTIKGLKINAAYSYVGLFGNVSGSISELNVADASVYLKDAYENISIVCGYSSVTISDVTASGFIDAPKSACVGAVVGKTTAQVSKVSSSAEVNGAEYVGGIAGKAELVSAVLSGISNSGAVNGGAYIGGLVGYVTASNTVQTDMLSNTGDVKGTQQVGGIFGYINAKVGSAVYSANVSANIEGEYYVGGIVGKADNVAISHCNNDGSTVTATSYYSDGTNFYVWLGGYVGAGYSVDNCINNVDINYNSRGAYVGGIAGQLNNTVTNCENNADITGLNNVGGIVGTINTTVAMTVSKVKNTGNISGNAQIGGIAGHYISTAATTLSSLENSGRVIADSMHCGGIIGAFNGGSATVTVADNVNVGDVVCNDYCAGGLFGFIDASTASLIKHSSSAASVIGKYRVGGLVGHTGTVTIQECSNEGSVVTATEWKTEGSTDYAWLGGYAGHGYKVIGCTNNSDINYEGTGIFVGGIVGYAVDLIQNCTNNGDVTSKSSYVGGIAGYALAKGDITYNNLINAGDITATSYVGGIFGGLVQNETNLGSKHDIENHVRYFTITFKNNGNAGKVSAEGNKVGGLVGHCSLNNGFSGSLYCCYRYSKCAVAGGSIMRANDVSNTGEVSGAGETGELFGYFWCDHNAYKSPLVTYKVLGHIILNGEKKEGNYDVGVGLDEISLSGREVYVPEVETPETPETPEGGESTENSAE